MKYHYSYYWTKFKDSIKYFFFPRNRWLTKSIPREWRDLHYLFETVILKGIVFYVEQDLTLENLNWKMPKDFPPHQKKFTKELRYIYKLITINLVKLESDLEKAWNKIPPTQIKYEKISIIDVNSKYQEIDLIESKINKLKDKILIWAILNRRSMWY